MKLETIKFILVNAHGCYNWKPYCTIIPRKTITGKWVWNKKIYKRKVRFVFDYPGVNPVQDIVQYGTSFDVISSVYQQFEK
jgi:hypothetical protein